MRKTLSILFALALVLSFSLVAATPVAAATINVPGDYSTIQAAVNAANPGDTIMVSPGTYNEQLTIDRAIMLNGAGPTTVINGGGGRAMQFRSPGPGALSGVRIGNMKITGQVGASFDGAMFPEGLNVVGVEFDSCVFAAIDFDGIGITNGAKVEAISVTNSVFEAAASTDNAVGISGAATVVNGLAIIGGTVNVATTVTSQGLLVFAGAVLGNLLIDGVTFNNPSRSAVMFQDCTVSDGVIRNSKLAGDTASSTGYGIYMGSSTAPAIVSGLTVSNVEFKDQRESAIIAFRQFDISGLTVQSCLFENNRGHITFYKLGTLGTVLGALIQGNTFKGLLGWHCLWMANGVDFASNDVVLRCNNLVSGGSGVSNALATTVDARYNWWGHASGPGGVGPGTGDAVTANVDFTPWFGEVLAPSKATFAATGTGPASFITSTGNVVGLTAVTPPSLPSVTFPHGMFSFQICCLTPGESVTLTVTLPSAVPVGTLWWKYNNGQWSSLPNLSDNGDNVMIIQLTDGGAGDFDSIPGQITDPGGPGNPMTVGWEGSPTSKATILWPWIAIVAAVAAALGLLVLRRRRAQI